MKRLDRIVNDEKNIGLDFIVHIKNKEELNDLIDVLTKNHFKIQLALEYSPNELKRWMEDIGVEEDYDTCFRIRNRENDKCIAHNPSIEHWRVFCNDIFEIRNGELDFNEGDYTLEAAKIEAKKIFDQTNDVYHGNVNCNIFGFTEKKSEEEIIKWLMTKFK